MNRTHKRMNLKKKLSAGLLALISLSTLLAPAHDVLAEKEDTWGGNIREAAETVLVTKLFRQCADLRHANYSADDGSKKYPVKSIDYVTTGWSLFQDHKDKMLSHLGESFSVGSWLESRIQGPFGDGQVYCFESPDNAGYKDNNGSEIVRLLSYYLLGNTELETMQKKLFCNKNDSSQWGLTIPLIEGKMTQIADNCGDSFEGTVQHVMLVGGTRTVAGKNYNYGLDYIKELYEDARKENQFIPPWDEMDDAIKNNDILRYFMFYDDFEAGSCTRTPVNYGGNLIKEVDYTTGEIIEKRYAKRENDDYDGSWDHDWDKVFYQILDGKGSTDDKDGNCQKIYPEEINKLAEAVSKEIKKVSGSAKDENAKEIIEWCYDNSRSTLVDVRANNNITILEQSVKLDNGKTGKIREAMSQLFSRAYYDVLVLKKNSQESSINAIKNAYFDNEGKLKESSARTVLNSFKDNNFWPTQGKLTLENVTNLVDAIDNARATILPIMIMTDEEFSGQYTGDKSAFIDENIKAFYDGVKEYVNSVAPVIGSPLISYDTTAGAYSKTEISYEESGYYVFQQYLGYTNEVLKAFSKEQSMSGNTGYHGATNVFYFDESNKNKINDDVIRKVVDISTVYKNDTITKDMINKDPDSVCPFGKNFQSDVAGKLDLEGVNFNFDANSLNFVTPGVVQDSYEDPGQSAESCAGSSGALSWILCPVIEKLAGAADWIYDKTLEPQLEISANDLAMPSNGSKGSGTYQAWQYTVGFANILLSILFLFVIFSQLTGYGIDNYGIKKILPKIIVVAVLINLSYIICQLSVDVSNILGANIQNLLENGIEVQNNTGGIEESTTVGSFLGQLLGYAGLGVVGVLTATTIARIQDKGGISALPKMIVSLIVPIAIILVSVLIAVVFFFLLLGVRRAGVIVLIILSPLAIACYALPNTKKYFTKWFNGFKGLLVLYPICGLVVGASTLVTKIINANSNGGENFITDLLCMFILVYPYFLIPTLVSRTIKAVTSLGDFISGFGNKLRKGSGNALRNSKYLKDAQDRNEANAQENRAKALKNRIDSIDPTKGNRLQRAINRARKDKLIAEQQEAEDKAAAIRDKKYGMWARYRAERDFDNDAGNKGRDYIDAENEARAASKQSEWENRVSGAIFTPERVDYESAKSRAQSRHDAEVTKSFKEQFADMNQGDLETAFKNALGTANINANPDDVNKLRALGSLLIDKGARKELQDALYDMSGSAAMGDILKDTRARNMLADLAGASGSENLKGYAKHLGAGKNLKTFSDYVHSTVGGKTDSLQGYYEETYGEDKDYTSKMDNDDLKFLNSKMDGTKDPTLSKHLNGLMGADTLMKGALTKRGKELTSLNEMIGHKLKDLGGNVDAFVKASGLSDAELASLDASTLEAMCGGDWAALRSALGEKRISEIESDPRLWAKFSEDTRKNLDPSWHFDFNAADAETKWNEMVAASGSADAVRTKMADQITTLKNSAGWGGLPAAFKDKIDPDWRRSERGERLRDGTASAADHTDIAADAAAAFSSSASDFESFITKQSGFSRENLKNLTAAVFNDIAGAPSSSQYAEACKVFGDMVSSLPFREWGGLDKTLLSTIKPGWKEEFIKLNALSSGDAAALSGANDVIRNAMNDAITKKKYATTIANANISAEELFKMDFSTLKAYAPTPTVEAAFRTAIDAAVKQLQSDPTRWAQLPTKKRDFLDPAWRGKPGLF